ncbi:MAG: SusD/RagB family nutrient-binding outer membrane lipoprotein [Chitinophagaceae bacterium]|nr:SusD/RagB family nutrient-binding outer membrane lipoprotein [Chitinophagaceae bacterium]
MKKNIKSLIIGTSIVGLVGAGIACNTDELKGLNVNPQALDNVDPNFLFTSVELGAASGGTLGDNRYIDWRTNINFAGYAIQQLASTGGELGEKYVESGSTFESSNAPFEFIYADQLKNISVIFKSTGAGGAYEGKFNNMVQAARIVRAFLFHRLTDYYGNIPYFESMKAAEGLYFPHYDSQESIYQDLLKELDEATAAIKDPADANEEVEHTAFARADIYFDGDLSKWRKWGNSLMLRLGMRVADVKSDWANTYVSKAVANGVMTSNADNVFVPMAEAPSLWTSQNGISRAFIPGDGGQTAFVSKTLVDMLKGPNTGSTADDDPRLMVLLGGIIDWTPNGFSPFPGGDDPLNQKGMPNGKNQTDLETIEGHAPLDLNTTYSKINPLLMDRDEPYMLMNYGEVELLQAEAIERGIGTVPGTAQAHYEAGVKASMQMYTPYEGKATGALTVSDAAVNGYLAQFPYQGGDDGLEQIGNQMWLNHYMNWWEAWSEWRRTGYPVLTPVVYPGNSTGGTIPVRLKYPNAEVAGNPNFSAGSSPNDFTTRVWWDVD